MKLISLNSRIAAALVISFCFIGRLPAGERDIAQRDWIQTENIPRWIRDIFTAKKLDGKYDFAFHINPFYLGGDFNGDNITDAAILVEEKNTRKIGIAIIHRNKNELFIIGAGRPLWADDDDFRWMNIWRIYPKGQVKQGDAKAKLPSLKGDALIIEKAEASTTLIYWDGKKYRSYTLGD
jgi:hypothetical protein